jgi:hypothetical protein
VGFEAAVVLAGLAAVVVPMALQIKSRRVSASVPFPCVDLVRRTSRDALRAHILSDAPLLLVRAAVIASAAVALSSPYLGAVGPNSHPLSDGNVVVLLDRSDHWRTRADFESARDSAREILRLAGPEGRTAVIAYDRYPASPVEGREAARAVDRCVPGGGAPDVARALAMAAEYVGVNETRRASASGPDDGRGPATIVVLSSSSQREAVDASPRPAGLRVYFLGCDVPDAAPVVSVAGGDVELSGQDAVVGLALSGCAAGSDVDVRVYCDDADDVRAARTGRVPPGDSKPGVSVVVPRVPRVALLLSVELRSGGGDVAPRHWMPVPERSPLRILAPTVRDRGDAGGVLTRALAALAACRVRPGESSVEIVPTTFDAVDADALDEVHGVVLGDAESVPHALWPQLARFVALGGGLLIATPGALPAEAQALAGVRARGRRAAGSMVLLDAAGDAPSSVEFPDHLELELAGARTTLAFVDGDPVLTERRVGRGHVAVLAPDIDDLGRSPRGALLVGDRLLDAIAAPRARGIAVRSDEAPLLVPVDGCLDGDAVVAVSPDGMRFELAGAPGRPEAGPRRWVSVPCDEPGLWRLRVEHAGAGYEAAMIGVNASGTPDGPGTDVGGLRSDLRVVGSMRDLVGELGGYGATRLGPLFAALAVILALVEPEVRRRCRARRT